MPTKESKFQAHVIERLQMTFPGCVVIKNDPQYLQGIPDILLLTNGFWAMLEVKASKRSPIQPNQEYYVNLLSKMSFAAFIFPENEEEVFNDLQHAFSTQGQARFFESEQIPLD